MGWSGEKTFIMLQEIKSTRFNDGGKEVQETSVILVQESKCNGDPPLTKRGNKGGKIGFKAR